MKIKIIVLILFLVTVINCGSEETSEITLKNCEQGWWGKNCQNTCPDNCLNDNCDSLSGACTSGCEDGWWGSICTYRCSEECDTYTCNNVTGACASCNEYYWGSNCTNLCSTHCSSSGTTCNKNTGCCNGCGGTWTGNCNCSISASCAEPSGASCVWYSECLEPATVGACPFMVNVMFQQCIKETELEPHLSELGQKWVGNVRACIQQSLAKTILVTAPSGEVDCETATEGFYNDIAICYLQGPVSFCSLPHSDQGQILTLGNGIIFFDYWYNLLSMGYELVQNCKVDFWETVVTSYEDTEERSVFPTENLSVSSLQTAMNNSLLSFGMKLTFIDVPTVSSSNTTSLIILSNYTDMEPINVPLAINVVESVMESWAGDNTNYQVYFNGIYQNPKNE
ncbi:EGF-like domain-containing protein [Tieghemostelium lacteum]|uniref:EGF-like domain-containing protein n=1 Tax=Tieghemostelium lacteum TaxID=361077 RepID=A0A151Z6P2_TIELA|nr:EGF-like domain-containing protein [Tieghemostelium lacteum]|eukprot:KYQ89454.1 EGF-like domain-containing protein [Tieghemostelium lacteum]